MSLLFYMSIHVFYRQSLVNKIWEKMLSSENHRLGVRIVLLTNKTVLLALKKEILSPFARNCLCLPRVPFEVMGVMYCWLCYVSAVLWLCCGCVVAVLRCVVVVLRLCWGCFVGGKCYKCCRCVEGVKWLCCVGVCSDSSACVVVVLLWLFVVVLLWLCCGGWKWRLGQSSGMGK